jgi:hypothetical protein
LHVCSDFLLPESLGVLLLRSFGLDLLPEPKVVQSVRASQVYSKIVGVAEFVVIYFCDFSFHCRKICSTSTPFGKRSKGKLHRGRAKGPAEELAPVVDPLPLFCFLSLFCSLAFSGLPSVLFPESSFDL